MNIHAQLSVWTHVLIALYYLPRNRTARSYKSLCWTVRSCCTVPTVSVPFYIPTSSAGELHLLHILINLVISLLYYTILIGVNWFFIFKIILAILYPLNYQINFRISLLVSVLTVNRNFDSNSTLSVDQFGDKCHLNTIKSSGLWT
jgi:hypothetical protein